MKENDKREGRLDKEVKGVFFPTPVASLQLPNWYDDFFSEIRNTIAASRQNIMWTANVQMTMMYYHIGKEIFRRQKQEGWGAKVIDRLSNDIKNKFPEAHGFSPRNLMYMRQFAEQWPKEETVVNIISKLPWRHNITLMKKIKEPNRRLLYAWGALKYGWSQSILDLQIEAYTLERKGKSPSNFELTMPNSASDMVQQMFKDPYLLDFTGSDSHSRKKDIEDRLASHITNFLLELGQGFAFVGRQVHLELGGNDFYLDMLFYHLRLRCYVVIELKADDFEPGMMGLLGMYQSVVDGTLKQPQDNRTIGLLLVKSKDETVARYSMEGYNKPMGVVSWETELQDDIKDKWKSSLPTIEEIEFELNKQQN